MKVSHLDWVHLAPSLLEVVALLVGEGHLQLSEVDEQVWLKCDECKMHSYSSFIHDGTIRGHRLKTTEDIWLSWPHPAGDISIKFKIRPKFEVLWFKCSLSITMKFCKRHASVTIMTCPKCPCDWLSIFWTRTLQFFITEFWIRSKYH